VYDLEWAAINKAPRNDSMAMFRAMRRFRHEGEEDYVERVLTSFEDGRFLIDRLGAVGVVDQDLVVVLLDLRRRLLDEYGDTPAAMMDDRPCRVRLSGFCSGHRMGGQSRNPYRARVLRSRRAECALP
jgi:hypothetical protein